MSIIDPFTLRQAPQTEPTYQPQVNQNSAAKSSTNTTSSTSPVTDLPAAAKDSSPISVVLQRIAELLSSAGGLSTPPVLIPDQSNNPNILQAVPTEEIAGQLHLAGRANTFNETWQALVADAANKNGGFGNAEEGFLGFSEIGFVRFYNPNLSEYQNKRMAEISLETGFQLEKMPSRADSSGENISQWVDKFIEQFDTQMAAFIEDPSRGISIRDGRKRFDMKVDPASGEVVSVHYKKKGGLRGFVEKNMAYIGPVADAVSMVGALFPGVGTAIAAVSQGIKQVASVVASGGKLAWNNIASIGSSILSMLPGAGSVTSLVGSTTEAVVSATTSGSSILKGLANSALLGLQNSIPSTGIDFFDNLISKGLDYGLSSTGKNNPNSYGLGDFLSILFKGPQGGNKSDLPATTTEPATTLNADDPLLEGFSEPIPGAITTA